jgi:2-polyprenyl-3-methyl-5-hydroxy-6-metoxy-1,4-benzoquinol methylase
MGIGPLVRRCLGPLERPVADLYRGFFFNLNRFVNLVRAAAPSAADILEVGCGEGAVLERLATAYPAATLVGIDITPRLGRLFRGDAARTSFRNVTIQDYARENPGRFDLAVVADVIHHVPWEIHGEFLRATAAALKPDGVLMLKDWERRGNMIHPVCRMTDSCITGDDVRYLTAEEFRALITDTFGAGKIVAETRVPPWPNNIVFTLRSLGDRTA